MSRKAKTSNKKKKTIANTPSQADKWLDLIGHQLLTQDYMGAVASSERLLNYLPQHAPQRVDVLAYLGNAQAMLQNYPQSYEAFTEALSLDPKNAELWYNRGLASRFTARFGRSFRDYQRAVELNTLPELSKRFNDELKASRKFAEKSIKLRGRNFTLDQLIEQEDIYQRGLKLMEAGQWSEAAQAFQASIDMGDCLPQPQSNLGICLMMQERYDEAEVALKRALVIEPTYIVAKRNLAILPETRKNGPPQMIGMLDPFKNSNMKQSITFIAE